MTPAQAIAMLDRQLAEHGQDVILRKANSTVGQITVRAKVRHYKSDEIAGIIQQGDSEVILSPTGLEAFGVPPQNGFVLDGTTPQPRRIVYPRPIYMGGQIVRIKLQVRG